MIRIKMVRPIHHEKKLKADKKTNASSVGVDWSKSIWDDHNNK